MTQTTKRPTTPPCTISGDLLDDIEFVSLDLSRTIWALSNGWTVRRLSLYDEESIEGWQWTAPNGDCYEEAGDWSEMPKMPFRAATIIDTAMRAERYRSYRADLARLLGQ